MAASSTEGSEGGFAVPGSALTMDRSGRDLTVKSSTLELVAPTVAYIILETPGKRLKTRRSLVRKEVRSRKWVSLLEVGGSEYL